MTSYKWPNISRNNITWHKKLARKNITWHNQTVQVFQTNKIGAKRDGSEFQYQETSNFWSQYLKMVNKRWTAEQQQTVWNKKYLHCSTALRCATLSWPVDFFSFSLTLVDSLDSLVVLGDMAEFEKAVELIIRDVTFDTDVIVSVFETNIRMLGGLISGHIFAEHLHQVGCLHLLSITWNCLHHLRYHQWMLWHELPLQEYGVMGWYKGEMLMLAEDLANRLLPAFNTSTGIPHPRVIQALLDKLLTLL